MLSYIIYITYNNLTQVYVCTADQTFGFKNELK